MELQTLRLLLGTSLLAVGLAGCAVSPGYSDTERELSQTMGKDSFQPADRALRDGIETQEILAQAAFWMRENELNPGDLEAAIKLAAAIRKVGNPQRAVEITQTTRALYPRDPYLAAEYAAALIASERSVDAMVPLDEALSYAPAYARLWSLKGAALDQQEQYDLARKHYGRALEITPNDPSIMANLGLSYALAGDPNTAEQWLRRAVSMPGATQSVRQNLALILQIQGKTEEAENMARLAHGQASSKLPNLNPQPSQTLRGSIPAPASKPTAQYNAATPYQTSGFSSAPPKVTVHNSPSVQGRSTPYAEAQSASDAARMAARQQGSRAQTEVVSPQQYQQQQEMLAKLAGNVGAKAANPAVRAQQLAYQQRAAAYGQAQNIPTNSSQNGMPYPPQNTAQPYNPQSYGQAYPPQPQQREPLRERR